MQLFCADATMMFFPQLTAAHFSSNVVVLITANRPVQNQARSQFLFHLNCSLRNLCIMTLTRTHLFSQLANDFLWNMCVHYRLVAETLEETIG